MSLKESVFEYPRDDITAVILAGGRSRRMGGSDKGLMTLQGMAMVEHVISRLKPQVGALVINANRNIETYATFGFPVIEDIVGDYFGPLAGMASGMKNAVTRFVLCAPCDTPLLGNDLVNRMYASLVKEQAEICVVHDGERTHPVIVLLERKLLSSMLDYLDAGERKIDRWFAQHKLALADFSDCPQCFMNINSPEEREALETRSKT
jgi:molybdopterin-guanine dinucleotide biosynthesis protein A